MLSDKELHFLKELTRRDIRFMMVGLSAATLQGAPVVTQDIDLWFEDLSDPRIAESIQTSGGAYVPSFPAMQNPPQFAGDGFHLLDIVTEMSGLPSFSVEYAQAKTVIIEGVSIKILPLDRIIHSKRTAGRLKDTIVLPALEAALHIIEKQNAHPITAQSNPSDESCK